MEIDELIIMGEKILERYQGMLNASSSGENKNWISENIIAAEILLENLKNRKMSYEKIQFLAKVIGEYHKDVKPPAIYFWSKKINELNCK